MECKTAMEMLHAYQEGGLGESVRREIEAHIQVCNACRHVKMGLIDSWNVLETWGDCEPPERLRTSILSRISRERILFWAKVALPVAAAILIFFTATFRIADLKSGKQEEIPLGGPSQLCAERTGIDEEEIIANLHILQDEEFFDALEELVKIDYLPLLEEPVPAPPEAERSSLEMICT